MSFPQCDTSTAADEGTARTREIVCFGELARVLLDRLGDLGSVVPDLLQTLARSQEPSTSGLRLQKLVVDRGPVKTKRKARTGRRRRYEDLATTPADTNSDP